MDHSRCVLVVPLYINHESLYPIVERFFDSLKEHYPDIPVYTVDDASPLIHDFSCTLRNVKNNGFTATVNDGLALAAQDGFDVAIVANDDLCFKPGDLDRFFGLDATIPIIASPRDTSADDTDGWGAIWGITRAAYDLLGPLDTRYKHFFSDKVYYKRARDKGVTIIKWRDIVIEHPESATYKNENKEALLFDDAETFMEDYPNG